MKLTFSNSSCSQLGLADLIEKSKAWGYQGFELAGLGEQSSPGPVVTLRGDLAGARRQLDDAGQQIVALNTGVLDPPTSSANDSGMLRIAQAIELATQVACPLVITTGAPLRRRADEARVLDRYVTGLTRLTRLAGKQGVTLAVENGGVFAQSTDTWHVWDAVGSPALKICLNPLQASRAGDPPSRAFNRLRGALVMVRLTCAHPSSSGDGERFVEVDHSATNTVFLLELLKGLAYDGWICLDCALDTPPADANDAEQTLENAAKFVRAQIDKPIVELTAYKGDKNAPKFVKRMAPEASPATA